MSVYTEPIHQSHSDSRPSTSHHIQTHINGHKRRPTTDFPNGDLLPLGDRNAWYYPSLGHDSDEKSLVGKITAWGPEMEDWEITFSPTLPHLARTPSPPLVSPYPSPNSHHMSYASFVLDKSITHTFRSSLLDELEHATNGLIEGETTMKRALGRLWQVMSEDPDTKTGDASVVPKREDEDEEPDELDGQARRVARAPDLTPSTHKIFLLSYPSEAPASHDPTHFAVPETQLNTLEKNLATLRELQDDGREYAERLQEIRDGLGDARAQRNIIWNLVRERAVKELQESAFATVAVAGV
ncbi:hypothetical protein BDZ97DRAFT_1913989 [Flammula alnicola]|nr:hypothetical protein BDZ97DRAFT_1913989 [Flammula alnicola]